MSVLAGVAREVIQNVGDDENNVADSAADAVAWASGAIAAGAIAWGVSWRLEK